jgi:hypothetical protein
MLKLVVKIIGLELLSKSRAEATNRVLDALKFIELCRNTTTLST